MKIRRKTIRRLLLLAAAVGATTSVVAATFYARRHARDERIADARATGMTEFAAGDLAAALPDLSTYISARPDDIDALFALASARMATETPGRDHLFEARSRFQQLLARQPNHLPAKRQLMDIYERTRLPRELLAIADDILRAVPGDVRATRSRAAALGQLDRNDEAIDAWQAYLRLAPTDFLAHDQLLMTMRRAGRPAETVIAVAQTNVDANPDDARFRLPLATALRGAAREDEARSILEALAEVPQTDPAFVVQLVGALDRARAFDVAERVLARSADALSSSTLTTTLVERMWQNGRHDQVIATTDRLIAAGRQDAGILALRALSLVTLGRRDEARAVAARLSAKTGDPVAAAWADALSVEFSPAPLAPAAQVRALRDALSRDPENGIVYTWLGRALVQMGEPDAAARCFRESAQRMPSWPTPCVELSQLALAAGRPADAAASAKAAYLRAPTAVEVQVQVARVRYAELLARPDAAGDASLLQSIQDLRARLPHGSPAHASLAPIQIGLLNRQGRAADAEAAIGMALALKPNASAILELYDVARRGTPAGAEQAFDRAVTDGLVTPQLAMLRVVDLAARPDGTNLALAWAKAQAASRPDDAAWQLVDVRARQALDAADAADAWRRVVATFSDDANVQTAALAEASSLLTDRAEQAAIVERLRAICGEDASPHRIARVRLLASSPEERDVRQALTLAADLVRQQPGRAELRVLLARVLVRLDSAATAIDHLRAAHDGSPGDAAIGLELAATLRSAGRADEAAAVLERLAGFDLDDANARDVVAQRLIECGQYDDAAAMLSRAASRRSLSAPAAMMRAEALEAIGDADAARLAFAAVADSADATPAALAAAAAFERRQGRADRAATLLQRVERAAAPIADRTRALARYALAFGELDRARAAYAAGVRATPDDVALACEAVDLEAGHGELEAAAALLVPLEARFADAPAVKRVKIELAARRAGPTSDDASMDLLIAAMSADPTARAELDALRALRAARAAGRITPELAKTLTRLAEASPKSIELAQRAIEAALATNQHQAAQSIAMRLLTGDVPRRDAVELAARTLLATGDRIAARRAASQWRDMSKDEPRDADVTLARIALGDGKAQEAADRLAPHRDAIAWDRDASIAAARVEAACRLGRAADALAFLEPALGHSAARALWASVAMQMPDAAAGVDALGRLVQVTPADATDERIRLAGVYLSLAGRSETDDASQHGLALLAPIETSGRLVGAARILAAELQRASGDRQQAELTLRSVLAADPTHAAAKNSLAYLLLDDAAHVTEAHRLATEAVAAAPEHASYRDTLARAEWAAGRFERAEAEFRAAIRADERCLDARIGLARLQTRLGQAAEAAESLRKLDADLAGEHASPLPMHLRGEFASLRESVSAAPDATHTP